MGPHIPLTPGPCPLKCPPGHVCLIQLRLSQNLADWNWSPSNKASLSLWSCWTRAGGLLESRSHSLAPTNRSRAAWKPVGPGRSRSRNRGGFIWILSMGASLTPPFEPCLNFTGLSCHLCMSGPWGWACSLPGSLEASSCTPDKQNSNSKGREE